MVKVTFEYDEETRLWEPFVEGVESELEGAQAFNAVVLTCQELDEELLDRTRSVPMIDQGDRFKIYPAVRGF